VLKHHSNTPLPVKLLRLSASERHLTGDLCYWHILGIVVHNTHTVFPENSIA